MNGAVRNPNPLQRLLELRRLGGPLALAMRASVSIPGVLPPVPVNGDLLADGGVLNNLSLDAMRQLEPGGCGHRRG